MSRKRRRKKNSNSIKTGIVILIVVCTVLSVLGIQKAAEIISDNTSKTNNKDNIESAVTEPNEGDVYLQIMTSINEGDIEKLLTVLLRETIDEKIYEQICREDKETFDVVMRDVLLYCDEFNDAESIVRLRSKGIVSDESFEQYWLVLGYRVERTEELQGVDKYLLYELKRFMDKDINDENFLKEIYGLGLLDEKFQIELAKRLK